MSRATKTRGKTPEQKQAEREALLASIREKVTAFTDTEEWVTYLRFVASFHNYSFNNILLILTQYPHATRVAGYRAWQALGRQVRKGEKSIKILGYSPKKVTEKDESTGEEKTRVAFIRYPVLPVFDVSQTEGADLPNGGVVVPTGEDTARVWDRVSVWLTGEGWTVTVEPIEGEVRGFTDPDNRRVVVDESLEPAGRAATLLHEAAHVVLHAELDPGVYQQHRGICETEAESTAYVLAHLLGQPADAHSIPYIAGWADANRELIEATAGNVLRAVKTISAGIGLDDEQTEAA